MKYVSPALAILVVLACALSPQLQALLAAHPVLVLVMTQVDKMFHYLLPSPIAQAEPRADAQ